MVEQMPAAAGCARSLHFISKGNVSSRYDYDAHTSNTIVYKNRSGFVLFGSTINPRLKFPRLLKREAGWSCNSQTGKLTQLETNSDKIILNHA